MSKGISRRQFLIGAGVAGATMMVPALSACGSNAASGDGPLPVRIGTMPVEDILPMWVAESEGIFDSTGVEAEIIVFDSAQSLSAALTSGDVDLAMTDPMRAIKLCESGTQVDMEWVTLGLDASQGRFGVLTSAESGYKTLADLVGCTKGVGVAANTVPEYVFDRLCEESGINPDDILATEVASLPDRYSLVASNQLDAAALPGSMLALGEASGLVLIADDSTGENISQSVMVCRSAFKDEGEAAANTLELVRACWDAAADEINADPETYRDILIANANLNEAVAQTYPISTYPLSTASDGGSAYPPAELIDPVVEWMTAKGYVNGAVSYSDSDGTITIEG